GNGTLLGSSDGLAWTVLDSGVTNRLDSIAYGNGTWVVCGDGGTILSSIDGTTWTRRTSGVAVDLKVAFGNGIFLAAAGSYDGLQDTYADYTVSSPDGINWSPHFEPAWNYAAVNSLIFADNRFVMVPQGYAGDAYVAVSSDGANWNFSPNLG